MRRLKREERLTPPSQRVFGSHWVATLDVFSPESIAFVDKTMPPSHLAWALDVSLQLGVKEILSERSQS